MTSFWGMKSWESLDCFFNEFDLSRLVFMLFFVLYRVMMVFFLYDISIQRHLLTLDFSKVIFIVDLQCFFFDTITFFIQDSGHTFG